MSKQLDRFNTHKNNKATSSAHSDDSPPQDETTEDAGGAPQKRMPRIYKGTQEIDHDLFKLEVGTMVKDVSYNDKPDLVKIEHVHLFHTVDSNGRAQETCTPVGGHCHKITVVRNADGVPSIQVGPPVKYIRKKVKGVYKKVLAPIILDEEEDTRDTHTHAVTYMGSEKIQLRRTNPEFAKFEATVTAQQTPSVDGVREG